MNAALLYMSDSDVEGMMHMNQWDGTIDEESTEENDTEEAPEFSLTSRVAHSKAPTTP